MSEARHLTTRRGFIVGGGFGGVSLYALWAAYGAAPGPLALLGLGAGGHDTAPAEATAAAHGGHGGTAAGPTADEFRRAVAEFVERYRMPDGSVYPRPLAAAPALMAADHGQAMPMMTHGSHATGAGSHGASATSAGGTARDHASHGAGHGAPAPDQPAQHGAAQGRDSAATPAGAGGHGPDGPIDVYILAERFAYEPAHLRLDAGVAYRLRMMAADVSHGASIQLGHGSRMIRLRPDTVTEIEASFPRSGSYLVYCTVYCGAGHDLMQGRIDVV